MCIIWVDDIMTAVNSRNLILFWEAGKERGPTNGGTWWKVAFDLGNAFDREGQCKRFKHVFKHVIIIFQQILSLLPRHQWGGSHSRKSVGDPVFDPLDSRFHTLQVKKFVTWGFIDLVFFWQRP